MHAHATSDFMRCAVHPVDGYCSADGVADALAMLALRTRLLT
jgi:hypothetical protein